MKIAIERDKSEFEIQAEALSLLQNVLGNRYIVRGEYSYRGCRFDLAIFNAESRDLVCTVEIKKRGKQRKHHRQLNKYHRATGKDCILLTEKTLHSSIEAVRRRLHDAGACGSNAQPGGSA